MSLRLPDRILDRLNSVSYAVNVFDSPVPEIERLINQSLLVGGKRLRPLLCLLVSDWIDLDEKLAKALARSVELIHAASLAHDDVLDESDFRRKRPTLRRISSNSRAILAGDLLLSLTLREVAELGSPELVQSLARSSEMLVYGEWLQQELIGKIDVEESQLLAVHQKKTSSLMEWAACAPLMIHPSLRSSDSYSQMDTSLRELGRLLGAAYQIIDDVVDYSRESEKPFALDLMEGLVNTVTLRMIQNNPALKRPIKEILESGELPPILPWREEELSKAILEMRTLASARIFTASRVLESSARVFGIPEDIKSAFESIFWLLGERKK
jgi:geranylgeranyl pyrophosphate synthase